MKLILTLVLVAGVAAACSFGSEDQTYPLPTAPIAWPLPARTGPISTPCPSTALAPVVFDWDATHRALSYGGPKVMLPEGFTARLLPTGRLELLAPDGTVVARDGDTLNLGGSDYEHVCRVQGVDY